MLLAIDIGNTTITLGLYDGETPGPRWRLETVRTRLADEYGLVLSSLLSAAGLTPADVDKAAMSSVVPPLTGTWTDVCRRTLRLDAARRRDRASRRASASSTTTRRRSAPTAS